MKKVISLLAAFATACSMGVASFAADDNPGVVRYSNNDVIFIDESGSLSSAPFVNVIGMSGEINVGAHELFVVDATSKVVGGVYNKLDPDTEYNLRIYYNPQDYALTSNNDATIISQGVEVTGQLLNGGTIQLRTVKGSSNIQSAKIKTIGRGEAARYEMQITTRAYYGTKLNEVEYSLDVTGSASGVGTFNKSNHIFEVGYETINDSETDVGEGGTITISNDAPVITKEQFVTIAKSANYKNVNFEGEDGGWRFTGRVSGMPDSNFYFTYDVIPEIVNKFPEQDYKFLTFKAGVTFPTNGEMRIDVSDINDDFGTMYAYLYRNGKLTRVATTYDSGANEVVFRTNYLGSFLITDTEITDTSIIAEEENEEENEEGVHGESGGPGNNPSTGASSAMDIAMTLGLVSLVTAGALSRKRK